MSVTGDYSLINDPEMKEIFDSFLVETKELLEKLDLDLVELEQDPTNIDLLNQIFRSFHTIKGTSGFLGLVRMQKVTHKCEDLLNKLRKQEATLTSDLMDVILESYDTLKKLLSVIENEKNENINIDSTVEALEQALKNIEDQKNQNQFDEIANVKDDKKAAVDNQKEKIDEEKRQKQISEQRSETVKNKQERKTIEKAELRQAKEKDNIENGKHKEEYKSAEVQKVETRKSDATAQALMKKQESSIRVDVERLDELLNIVSELVLGRNRLLQVNAEVSLEYEGTKIARDLADTSKQIDLMTTELQLAVMKTRMVKIGKVFNKFPRLVRDLSKDFGKEIRLEISGEDTELDKTLIEEINDPLVHLIRNAADHGIELPETRIKKGKDSVGTIKLFAEHEGNNIIITVEDDGKGMDPEILKRKAVEKGLISPEKAAEMGKQEAFNLIFMPGFSTAEKVTNISGRGVGMDVVKTNVTKLRGIINIESTVDVGTKFIIKLPLTLAIIQGLLVEISNETVVIPLNSVIEVVRILPKDIYSINRNEVIKLRDSVLPLLSIGKILYEEENNLHDKEWQYVVVVGIAEKRFGIKVDNLIGQKEVVIKSLGVYLGAIEGISGSTIMGDGKVVMILDIGELIHHVKESVYE
jgi:two-component system chemotaxis sensor kinase CheA